MIEGAAPYDPSRWYWRVGDDDTRVYSSAAAAYVPVDDETYMAWVAAGGFATRIVSEAELQEVLLAQYPAGWPAPPIRQIAPLAFIDRFPDGVWGSLLVDAMQALQAGDPTMWMMLTRLQAARFIDLDDPTLSPQLAGLVAAGKLTQAQMTALLADGRPDEV